MASDRYEDDDIEHVGYDSRAGLGEAIDHLVDLGHRAIGYVQPLPPVNHDFNERLNAFRDGVARHNLDPSASPVINAEFSHEGGASAIDQLMSRQRPPTTIIFATPVTTIGGIRRAMKRGLDVPQDLSIVGFDDGQLRHQVFPSYSAICQDARRIGAEAAGGVLGMLRNRKAHVPIKPLKLLSSFEVNETSAPARVTQR